jgi:hypothetical protein
MLYECLVMAPAEASCFVSSSTGNADLPLDRLEADVPRQLLIMLRAVAAGDRYSITVIGGANFPVCRKVSPHIPTQRATPQLVCQRRRSLSSK